MRPKIMTSYRPHGKWGDFLAAIIPALWCLNILTNSNFILRLIEWQAESSLFTVRVRARQWYWVYKYELKSFTDILSTPKNVGSNKWILSFFGDLETSDDYLHVLQLRRNNKWIKNYWANLAQKVNDTKNTHSVSSVEFYGSDLSSKIASPNECFNLLYSANYLKSSAFLSKRAGASIWGMSNSSRFNVFPLFDTFFFSSLNSDFFLFKDNRVLITSLFSYVTASNASSFISSRSFNDFSEVSRFVKRTQGLKLPFRLMKNFISPDENYSSSNKFLNFFFGDGLSKLEEKSPSNATFLVLKQKKYTAKSNLAPSIIYDDTDKKLVRYSGRTILLNNSIFHEYIDDSNIGYRLLKKNKKRSEVIPTTLAKRLLRTRRTLVLPAHINITLITNSFDIVHSWFIPGLGVKLDCVPGRSTHHTFYVDNVGFYFGQCAEICGRYHHHMPIRVCALPFEHFLVWWNVFGLSRLATLNKKNYQKFLFVNYKYAW
jgi:heme/copper-type cytochrome/quinol oxidase subunit 2